MRHILVPLDGSGLAQEALPHAALLARLFDARITLACVPEPVMVADGDPSGWAMQPGTSAEARERVERYLVEVLARPELAGLSVTTTLPPYPVAAGLIEAIGRLEVDLVVTTTHGRSGLTRWLLGSVADKLIRYAPVPVYVVRPTKSESRPVAIRQIVVPLDGSSLGEGALADAIELARLAGAKIDLVQVPVFPLWAAGSPGMPDWPPVVLEALMDEAETYLGHQAVWVADQHVPVTWSPEVIKTGTLAEGILARVHALDADVVVMSTHGRGGFSRWAIGSVADHFLRLCDRPVWVVRTRLKGA